VAGKLLRGQGSGAPWYRQPMLYSRLKWETQMSFILRQGLKNSNMLRLEFNVVFVSSDIVFD